MQPLFQWAWRVDILALMFVSNAGYRVRYLEVKSVIYCNSINCKGSFLLRASYNDNYVDANERITASNMLSPMLGGHDACRETEKGSAAYELLQSTLL